MPKVPTEVSAEQPEMRLHQHDWQGWFQNLATARHHRVQRKETIFITWGLRTTTLRMLAQTLHGQD